jgi:ABC-type phosphate transport system substrate-binding protein
VPVAGYPAWGLGTLIAQNGPDNASNYVAAPLSLGSITYVPTSFAAERGVPVASMVNESGAVVQPSSVNGATALQKASLNGDLTANLTGVFGNTEANAYPVSSYSYFVAPCSPSLAKAEVPATKCSGHNLHPSSYPAASGAALGTFLNYAVCAGQEKTALLGYVTLPRRLVAEAFSAIDRINGANEPASPTAANCPDPYVDGQVVLPK